MKLTIEIEMDNDAFESNGNGAEAARILKDLWDDIDCFDLSDGDGGDLYDINGNKVGFWHVAKEQA